MSSRIAIGSTIAVLAIMVIVCADVFLRGLTGASFGGAVEYAEVLLVVVVALGIAAGQRDGSHVGVDLVTSRINPRVASVVRAASHLLALGLLIWMIVVCAALAWDSFVNGEVRFGLRRVPLWPARAAITFGLGLLAYEVARTVVLDIRGAVRGTLSTAAPARPVSEI